MEIPQLCWGGLLSLTDTAIKKGKRKRKVQKKKGRKRKVPE